MPGLLDQQQPGPAVDEEEVYHLVSDGISDYIHSDAREVIVQELQQSADNLGETMAAMAYRMVREAADEIEGVESGVLTIDLVLAVATDTIDYLIEIADAVGVALGDEQKLREETLLEMVAIHMEQVGDDPEQRAQAEALLEDMLSDGSYQEAMDWTDRRMAEEGVDPQVAFQAGVETVGGPQ